MDYSKLHWWSDFLYSETHDRRVSEEDDRTVGLYTMKDFPEIRLYIDIENDKVLEVWLENETDENIKSF